MPIRHFHVDVKQDLRVHTSKTELDSIPSPNLPSSRLPHLTNRHHYSLSCSGKTLKSHSQLLSISLHPTLRKSRYSTFKTHPEHDPFLLRPPLPPDQATISSCLSNCSTTYLLPASLFAPDTLFSTQEPEYSLKMSIRCCFPAQNSPITSHHTWNELNSSPFLTKPCTVSAVYLSASSPTISPCLLHSSHTICLVFPQLHKQIRVS